MDNICSNCNQIIDERLGYGIFLCNICHKKVCGCCIKIIGNHNCCNVCCEKDVFYVEEIEKHYSKIASILEKWRKKI
jgi:hypothetical protein